MRDDEKERRFSQEKGDFGRPHPNASPHVRHFLFYFCPFTSYYPRGGGSLLDFCSRVVENNIIASFREDDKGEEKEI